MMKKFIFPMIAICLIGLAFFTGYQYGAGATTPQEILPDTVDLLFIPNKDTVHWEEAFEIAVVPYVGKLEIENIESSGPRAEIVSDWSKQFITFRYSIPKEEYQHRMDSIRINFETQVLLGDSLQTLRRQFHLKSIVDAHGDSLFELKMNGKE